MGGDRKQQRAGGDYMSSSEQFADLNLSAQMQKRLSDLGLATLSPIQRKTFQPILEGRDVIAQSPTGTGKTLAYCLPVVERLHRLL